MQHHSGLLPVDHRVRYVAADDGSRRYERRHSDPATPEHDASGSQLCAVLDDDRLGDQSHVLSVGMRPGRDEGALRNDGVGADG